MNIKKAEVTLCFFLFLYRLCARTQARKGKAPLASQTLSDSGNPEYIRIHFLR